MGGELAVLGATEGRGVASTIRRDRHVSDDGRQEGPEGSKSENGGEGRLDHCVSRGEDSKVDLRGNDTPTA